MSQRLDYNQIAPAGAKALGGVYGYVTSSGLPAVLVDLVYLRVSQINGCAFCMDMHGTALRKAGVEPRKLDTVAGWRDSRFFDERERTALAWAEALTHLPSGAPADATYDALTAHFDEQEIAEMTMAIATINTWNRLGVGLQPELP